MKLLISRKHQVKVQTLPRIGIIGYLISYNNIDFRIGKNTSTHILLLQDNFVMPPLTPFHKKRILPSFLLLMFMVFMD